MLLKINPEVIITWQSQWCLVSWTTLGHFPQCCDKLNMFRKKTIKKGNLKYFHLKTWLSGFCRDLTNSQVLSSNAGECTQAFPFTGCYHCIIHGINYTQMTANRKVNAKAESSPPIQRTSPVNRFSKLQVSTQERNIWEILLNCTYLLFFRNICS